LVAATGEIVIEKLQEIFAVLGYPVEMRADNGSEFINELFNEFLLKYKIHLSFSPPEYHEANGKVESHVKIAKRLIKQMVDNELHTWADVLNDVQFTMNSRVTVRHGSTPFSLMFARRPNITDADFDLTNRFFDEEAWVNQGKILTSVIYPAVLKRAMTYNDNMIQQFSKANKILQNEFPPGSFVYRLDTNKESKSHDTYVGPYRVIQRLIDGAYLLKDGTGSFFPSAVAAKFLKLALVSDLNEEETYEVERILNHRGPVKSREYLVRWKHYDAEHDSWVSAADMNAPALIRQYWSTNRRCARAAKR
jgi:hypothetical protein